MKGQGKTAGAALKICGLRRPSDVVFCIEAGVQYLGYNLCSASKRFVSAEEAAKTHRAALSSVEHRAAGVGMPVAVVVDATPSDVEAIIAAFPQLEALQCHGGESPASLRAIRRVIGSRKLWKAVRVGSRGDIAQAAGFAGHCDLILFDTAAAAPGATVFGGSGQRFDWAWLRDYDGSAPYGVAGGIKPGDLSALRGAAKSSKARLSLIDVCSGVEASPGVKDHALIDAIARELEANA